MDLKIVVVLGLAGATCASAAIASDVSGRANICAIKDLPFDSYREIKLPAKTVFQDSGQTSDNGRDPWNPQGQGSLKWAAFITTDPVTLTKAKPCAESGARMLIGPLMKASSARAADRAIWGIDDVLDYAPTSGSPPVEFGTLIDDISIQAVLLKDASDLLTLPPGESDEAILATKCLAGARAIVAHEGGTIGRQTRSVVIISYPGAEEFSYGCDEKKPDLFVSWNPARPAAAVVKLIASVGGYLTGAPAEKVKQELAKCVNEALKPDAGESANREFDGGVRIECQAFERDGGGGSATVYRRFGIYPVHEAPDAKTLTVMKQASAALAAVDDAKAAESLQFAKWWLDPAIPTKVKSHLMRASRIVALAERCPTWKPDYARFDEDAASAGVLPEDIKPGGKYFATLVQMMAAMKKGTEKESVEEACETAKKYDGN
jgi:hypothetical protein